MRSDFPVHARLTGREREVLHRLLRGWSVPAIGNDLIIGVSTARMHLRNLHTKARTNNLQALTLWSITHLPCCIEDRKIALGRGSPSGDDFDQVQPILIDDMAQALIATGAADRVTAWNRRAEQLYGWLGEEALGRPIYELTVPKVNEQEAHAIMDSLSRGQSWSGEFLVTRRDGSTFLALVQNTPIMVDGKCVGVIGLSEDVTERSLNQHAPYHDELTELPNRRLLQDRLRQAMAAASRSGEKIAIHSFDLDEFKDVTTALGETPGVDVVRLVARRLSTAVREADTVARLCCHEFVVMQVGARGIEDVAAVAERLVLAFESPFELEGKAWSITASSGVAVYPDDGHDFVDLHAAAQSAMRAAKAAGPGRFEFFKPEFATAARDRLEIGSQLRSAVEAGGMQVAFQPIVRAADGAVIAVEALARFMSPTRGPVGPDVFIPIAESNGLIAPLTEQVCALAIGWLREWLAAGHDIGLNLNLSPLVVQREGFEERLRRTVMEHGIPPSRVTLELTESALLAETAPTTALLERLHAAGYGLAVDDFGTGYSMLTSLRCRSLTSLKLDQVFVADLAVDPRHHALVRFAIGLGHDLGLTVVAEGVETEAQFSFLREEGIDECQGYLFARPMPGEDVAAFLRTWKGMRRPLAGHTVQRYAS